MRFLAFVVVLLVGCSRPKVTQSIEVLVKSQGIGVVSSAQISIDQRPIGVSNAQGIWRGRMQFEANSKHKISIDVEKNGIYFSSWEAEFVANGDAIKKVADLFSVPKLSGNAIGDNGSKLESHAVGLSKSPAEALGDALGERPSERAAEAAEDPFEIWRKNYTKYTSSLPPMMPWLDQTRSRVFANHKQVEVPPEGTAEKAMQTSTFYLHSQSRGQEGGKFWVGLKEPKEICSTNSRGRCSVETSPQTNHLLVTHEGFKSQIVRPRGQGTHYLRLERGFSRDLFVAAGDESWKVTAKGMEVVRGVGASFVVLDHDTDELYLECAEQCSSKPQKIVFSGSGITTIQTRFTRDLLPLKVEKMRFAGDFEGSLDHAYSEIANSIPLVLKKHGFRQPRADENDSPSVVLTFVKNATSAENVSSKDLSLEVLFLNAKADVMGASLGTCDNRITACFVHSFERAYWNSRNLKPDDIKNDSKSSPDTEVKLVNLEGKPLSGARLYRDGLFLGKSRENGNMLVPSLTSKTLEIVNEGYKFYRNYISSPQGALPVSLARGSALVLSHNPEISASIYQDGLRVGKLPGVVAVKSTKIELDAGEHLKKIEWSLESGESLDLSTLKFYPDLLATWKNQVLSRDYAGAEKTAELVTNDHPDWAPLAYLRAEKLFVEKGLISADLETLGHYPTARWLNAKITALKTIESAKSVDDFKSLDASVADILLVSGKGPSYEFFSELHYLRSLSDLKRSMILKDPLESDLALRKVNEWFEWGYGNQYQSIGRRMWALAREQSMTNRKGM